MYCICVCVCVCIYIYIYIYEKVSKWRFKFSSKVSIFILCADSVISLLWQGISLKGERSGLQAGQFITWTLLLRSHAVVITAVCGFALSCWNTLGFPWNRHHLEGSICCSKTFIYLSAFIAPSKTCKLPIPYALMHPHTIRDAGFCTECW